MKLKPRDSRNALSALRLSFALSLATILPLLLYGSSPSWWSARGVFIENAAPDDYAPANQGQLKNITKAAVAEMDAKLSGGAGGDLHALISSWSAPTEQTNDFSPVNLGQLKRVAKPCYDRLIAAGLVDFYPWLSSSDPPQDFAVANIGQVKALFSFQIPGSNILNDSLADRITAGALSANLALATNIVWIWHSNAGTIPDFERNNPRRVSGLSGIRSVSAGERHLVALAIDGSVLTWGDNSSGQLGDPASPTRETPALVPNLINIISVKAGGLYTLALHQDGTVLAWGDNYYGQLGNGDTNPSSTPVAVVGLQGVRKIAAGYARSVALTSDGGVWTWGYDHYAGHDIFSMNPTVVPDLIDVVDIAAGYEHTIAVKVDGTVWAWGSNYSNQIGYSYPGLRFQDVPVQVPNLSNIAKVASSYDHSLALASDGTVWAWGANYSGQLGDGTTQTRTSPVQVTGLTNVIAIATASDYSLAMKADGTVWTWGNGATGTLPGVDLRVPQQVGLGLFDTNQNGMDDRWELKYLGSLDGSLDSDLDGDGVSNRQEFFRGTNPADYFNGIPPVIEIAGGNNQVGSPGAFLPKPFKVRVRNPQGALLVNAPVTFKITDGAGALATTFDGGQQQQVTARTDANGEAIAYHALPNVPGTSTRTTVTVGDSASPASATFRGIVQFTLPPTPTPAPTPPDPNATPTPTPSPTPTPVAPYRYAIIDLGKEIYPYRINNLGQILLEGVDQAGIWGQFRWKGGNLEKLNYTATNVEFGVKDMNDAGDVVGSFTKYANWVQGGENESGGGLHWPATATNATKVSGHSAYKSFEIGKSGTFRLASLNAINNRNELFGQEATGSVRGFGMQIVMNSQVWPAASVPLSVMTATNTTTNSDLSTWQGSSDDIRRANSKSHYIGRKFTPVNTPVRIKQGVTTGMINGQSVPFDPVDINEDDVVIGYGSSGSMIIGTPKPTPTPIPGVSPSSALPSYDYLTLPNAYPVAINSHTRPLPSPSPQPSPLPSPQPTPIPIPQILAWVGNALVIWERQEDGKTWHPFGLEEMIPSMEGWTYIEPYDVNDSGAIVGRGWYKDPSTPNAQGEYHAFMLVPVEVMVDGNRDGAMSFDEPAVHKADQTSEEKPYRFWVNSDSDGMFDGQEIEDGPPDYDDIYLNSSRDLEDFSRLWISFKGFTEMVRNGGATVQLEWKPMNGGTTWPGNEGNPAINVFKAVETDGGHKYLTDKATAKNQVAYGNTPAAPGEYGTSLGRVGRGQPLTLPASFFATLSESQSNKFLLFEGAGEGKGQLVLTVQKNGQKIGEYPPLYLDLKDVRRMYERGKITLDAPGIPDPWDNDSPPPLTWDWDPWNWQPEIDPNAEHKTIAFVHGWRMTYGEYLLWANTTFKRLWHLGYKGRFYSFRWPTYHGDNNGPNPVDIYKPGATTYNPSEYRAWLSGAPLANFVNGLPNPNARYLIAHSMGNVASGAALRNNMQVTRYAMCNAAMAAMAYDGTLQPDDPSYQTPDTDVHSGTRQTFGLANKFNPVGTQIINFSLPLDSALAAWGVNNAIFKPQRFGLRGGKFYEYRSSASAGSKLMLGELSSEANYRDVRAVTSVPEAMGYVTKSRTRAAGVRQDTRGSVVSFVNMGAGADGFQFGDEHSAEWVYPIQATYPFWKEILTKFALDVN